MVEFFLCADNAGGNALWDPAEFPTNERTRATADRSRPLEATTLDRAIEARALRPRLIKIDTEGAEQRVLEGAIGALFEQHPPYIVAELHEFGLDKLGCSQRSLRELMSKAGYETYLLRAGARPRRVNHKELVRSAVIVNLLFARPADVDAAWPQAAAAA